jgi:hypothetical protein
MSCCGKQRANWRGELPRIPRAHSVAPRAVYFRYVGNQTITVVGSATGRTYRFSGAGATTAVDPKDAPSIASVPLMTQVSDL